MGILKRYGVQKMKTIEKVVELGTKIKTYNDYHTMDEVIKDFDDLFGLLKDVEREYNTLYKKYQNVLELSKENADAAEYCLRGLESKLDKIVDICKDAPNVDSEMSMRILEVLEIEELNDEENND
jgi:oligoribonuclease (3'-5' exoribonuclease)